MFLERGIVDEDVELAELRQDTLDRPLAEGGIRDIAADRNATAPFLLDRCDRRLRVTVLVEIGDGDVGAFAGEQDSHRAPDAGITACHERDQAVELFRPLVVGIVVHWLELEIGFKARLGEVLRGKGRLGVGPGTRLHGFRPFFAAFAPLLFGRPPRSFRTALRQSVLKADSLSQWRAAFASMIPDSLLAPKKKGAGSRERLFSPLVTFWAFLSQVLSPNSACREAVRKVQAWWMLRSPLEISADTSAYCQARQRLSEEVLLDIHAHLSERMEANAPSDTCWLSREVKIVDGTCLSMPDTAENQAAYPQPSSQKKGCGFPMMKLVGLFSLKSGALLHFARGTLRVHEIQLFRQLWAHLSEGDIGLGDRGFCSFFAMASLLGRGVDSLMRLHQARHPDFRCGKRLSKDDILWVPGANR